VGTLHSSLLDLRMVLGIIFLKAYFSHLGHTFSSQDISEVREGEKLRARQVLGFYVRFMQFSNWPCEFLRFAYFTPFVLLYLNLYVGRRVLNALQP